MADSSITLNSGQGGSVVETETTTGTGDHQQVIRQAWGAAGERTLVALTAPLPVQTVAYTSGGCSVKYYLDVDETEEEVKATAGQLFGFYFANRTTAPLYLKFYNLTATNTTVGTSTITAAYTLPANASDYVAGTVTLPYPVAFDTAICVAATTGIADNDTTGPAANGLTLVVYYK